MPCQVTERLTSLLVVLATLFPFGSASAQGAIPYSSSIEVAVGGSRISIPIPSGFADASRNADLSAVGEALTPRHRRLLGFFVEERDLKAAASGKEVDLRQTFAVQTSIADERKTISEDGFAKVKEQAKAEFRNAPQSIPGRPTRFEELLKQLDKQARLDVKGVVPVGVIEESTHSITVLFVARSQVRAGGGVADDTNISAITIAAVKGKPVWLITRRTLQVKSDIEVASASARGWIAAVRAVNP